MELAAIALLNKTIRRKAYHVSVSVRDLFTIRTFDDWNLPRIDYTYSIMLIAVEFNYEKYAI